MKGWTRFLPDCFVSSLFIAIFLAWCCPPLGSSTGTFSLSNAAHWGISVIFFFYGLRLNGEKIRSGLANGRLHLLTQGATFILFPLLIWGIVSAFGLIPRSDPFGTVSAALWLGVFFLAALPSTVSSSVVMVNIAGGNLPAAIFNASLSSLFGVFITPIWMRIYLNADTGGTALVPTLISLTVQVILPVGLGILLNRRLGWFSQKYDRALRRFDQSIIWLIVYTSFCHSFQEEMFDGFSWQTLVLMTAGLVLLFFAVYALIGFLSRLMRFSRQDRITALFCGSKKSLVHGTVMSAVLLADPKLAGLLILPTMIYHAMQLLIVGIIARRYQAAGKNNAQQ